VKIIRFSRHVVQAIECDTFQNLFKSAITGEQSYMIRKLVFIFIVIAIGATIAYQLGWLSGKGEDVYDKTRESVIEGSEKIIDKTKDAIK